MGSKVKVLNCKDCGGEWAQRFGAEPTQCAKCGSRHWKKGSPRKHSNSASVAASRQVSA